MLQLHVLFTVIIIIQQNLKYKINDVDNIIETYRIEKLGEQIGTDFLFNNFNYNFKYLFSVLRIIVLLKLDKRILIKSIILIYFPQIDLRVGTLLACFNAFLPSFLPSYFHVFPIDYADVLLRSSPSSTIVVFQHYNRSRNRLLH